MSSLVAYYKKMSNCLDINHFLSKKEGDLLKTGIALGDPSCYAGTKPDTIKLITPNNKT